MPSEEFKVTDGKRTPVFAYILIAGPGGSGKTYSALLLAKGLGGKVVVVDSESKPVSVYGDEFTFKVVKVEKPFTPERFRSAIRAAMEQKPSVLIVDTVTHEWMGSGGILSEMNKFQEANPRAPQFLYWKDATPKHDRFVEALTSQKCHVIACARGREKFVVERVKDDQGRLKNVPKSIGTRPLQRKDFRYDFMLAFILDPETHNARVLTNVTKWGRNWEARPLTEKDGREIGAWARGPKK